MKIYVLYIQREYFICLQSIASVSFLQKCINFVEQWSKISHFKGSIILWHCSNCAEQDDSTSVSVAKVMWTYKSNVNSTSRGNSK